MTILGAPVHERGDVLTLYIPSSISVPVNFTLIKKVLYGFFCKVLKHSRPT